MKNGKEKKPLVIYFGGNGESSSKSFKKFNKNEFKDMFQGFNVISIDYPSYGKSEGAISDKTMFDTSKEIYDYAINRNDVDKNKIVIIGYSIGTGVATYLSSERYVKGLVLISPYDSGYSIYNSKLNIFYGPMKIFVKYKFDSIKYAKKINIRPLIIVSKDDKIISYKLAENLSKYFKAGNEFILLKGFNHNFYWSKSIVRDKIKEYIKSII